MYYASALTQFEYLVKMSLIYFTLANINAFNLSVIYK